MCRIFAALGTDDATLQSALTQFGNLAEVGKVRLGSPPGHKDGWGLASYTNGLPVLLDKEPASAAKNPGFEAIAQKLVEAKPDLTMGHLRKASVGSLALENTQPYSFENLTFCHNGTIQNFEKISLNSESFKLRKGTSDSEWLFLRLRELFLQNPSKSLEQLLKEVRGLDYSAFIILFSNGKTLWALREVNEEESSIKKEGALDSYYTLFLGIVGKGAVLICSEKLDLPGVIWTPLHNHELAEIELGTRTISRSMV
ncbi:MAG: class II glutamine amidotransferase [Candidatus Liptonbacteria bacterium]|nr:class II glutamine amidotransferase [Candidatus Liptonbacteria bacterium]